MMERTGSSRVRAIGLALFAAAIALVPVRSDAQSGSEYRSLWVETFNTPLGTHADIDKVINAAVSSRSNAIFAQIRRRGDSWYLDSLEPLTQVTGVGEPDASGTWTFDPLQYLIEQAHARGIEVHAFVIIGAIYNLHPTITGVPKNPAHVFNQHFWDNTVKALYPDTDPRQWSTRALPHNFGVTTFSGHRFTSSGEWYVDLGHPDAEAYTVDVLTHLVSRYDLDGLHLDRIRYPEAPIDQPTGSPLTTWGINVGYNETSVNRFKARYGSTATYYTTADIGKNVSSDTAPAIITAADVGYPRTNDPLWNNWRREQVTNLVRRVYLNAAAVKPRIKVSAALICFYTGPTASGGWERTEANYRVFQDWRAWMQEGILDIAAPMIYKREHSVIERAQFDDWLAFTKSLAQSSGRHAMPGIAAYLNGIEGSLRQARRALARTPFTAGNTAADGVIFYALGNTGAGTVGSLSAAVTSNPFSYPIAGVNTPKRTNPDFFAGVTTGAGVGGTTLFEDPGNGPLFGATVPTPDMPWKSTPTLGHMMGFAIDDDTHPLDGGSVTIEPLGSPAASRLTSTDGGGFYGLVGLSPGAYQGHVELAGVRLDICRFDVTPGSVTHADARRDTAPPHTLSTLDPAAEGDWYRDDVRVLLTADDDCSGVARIEYSIDGVTWLQYSGPITVADEGTTNLQYRAIDNAGNVESASAVTLRIDKTDPVLTVSADRIALWPPTGETTTVNLSGSATDAISGLAGVSYEVIDEYGMPFTIAPRPLTGTAATWTDAVALEASRRGDDLDGRLYRVIVTVRNAAGRSASSTVQIVVAHDERR